MLNALFNPKSIAVIGASRHPGKLGHTTLQNIIKSGYKGRIFPVNSACASAKGGSASGGKSILGLKCYPDVASIKGSVDLLVFSIPAPFVLPTLQDIVKSGRKPKAAIIITAGFKETGPEGAAWELDIARLASANGIRIIGPNGIGLIDTHTPLNATFSATAKMPPKGNIAFFSQSGAFSMAILDWVIKEGTGLSKLVSLGNKMDVDETDLIEYMAGDKNTSVILAYLEGIRRGRRFMEVACRVSCHKPIIILKGGTTEAGARAVSSHTGSLAGKDIVYQCAFNQSGVIRVNTIAEMFDIAKALSTKKLPPLKGPRIAVITNSGGPAVLATDRIVSGNGGLKMATFAEATINKLRETLPKGAGIYNPVDVIADASSERYRIALETAHQDKNVDGILVIFTPATKEQPDYIAATTVDVFRKATKPILTSFMGGEIAQKGIKTLEDNNLPHYPAPENAIAVFEAMYKYQLWKELKNVRTEERKNITSAGNTTSVKQVFNRYKNGGNISLEDAMGILSAYGIRTPQSILTTSLADAQKAAERIGYPVALKIVSPEISHKTDVGGVKLNIHTPADLNKAYQEIISNARVMDGANIKGVIVQEMILGGKEIIIGVNKDPQFGHLVMFGLGGIYVEVLKDVAFRLAPLTQADVETMIREIRSYQLLAGIRGEEPSDINTIKDTLLKVSQLVTDFPDIQELDINPFKVFPKGGVALDTRIRI